MDQDIQKNDLADAGAFVTSDELLRHQFYVGGEQSYQDTLRKNVAFPSDEVKAYFLSRVKGNNSIRPVGLPLHGLKELLIASSVKTAE